MSSLMIDRSSKRNKVNCLLFFAFSPMFSINSAVSSRIEESNMCLVVSKKILIKGA